MWLFLNGLFLKVQAATNTNQKEKYEADLKKEIKKLQVSNPTALPTKLPVSVNVGKQTTVSKLYSLGACF